MSDNLNTGKQQRVPHVWNGAELRQIFLEIYFYADTTWNNPETREKLKKPIRAWLDAPYPEHEDAEKARELFGSKLVHEYEAICGDANDLLDKEFTRRVNKFARACRRGKNAWVYALWFLEESGELALHGYRMGKPHAGLSRWSTHHHYAS